jgi:hypothetical protein
VKGDAWPRRRVPEPAPCAENGGGSGQETVPRIAECPGSGTCHDRDAGQQSKIYAGKKKEKRSPSPRAEAGVDLRPMLAQPEWKNHCSLSLSPRT